MKFMLESIGIELISNKGRFFYSDNSILGKRWTSYTADALIANRFGHFLI